MKEQSKLMAHCGGEIVSYEDLAEIAPPEKTRTYEPVLHTTLVDNIRNSGRELLRREIIKESFAVTREGQRLFGLITFANGNEGDDLVQCTFCHGLGTAADDPAIKCPACHGTGWLPECGVSIGVRNSYDMSMSIGIAMGFRVFVCDNLAFSGEIKVLRKHTKKVWEDLDQILVYTLFRKGPELVNQFRADVATLKGSRMDRDVGYEFMGFAYGRQLLTPTQFSVAANEWEWKTKAAVEKDHVPHAWDLYNAITVGLKSTPPAKIMEKHRDLHQHLLGYAE